MQKKVFKLGTFRLFILLGAHVVWFFMATGCAIFIMQSHMYDEKSTIIYFAIFLFGAVLCILNLIICRLMGLFVALNLTDDGISSKNISLIWDDVHVTVYKRKAVATGRKYDCYMIFDKEYVSGVDTLEKKRRQSSCILLNSYHFKYTIPVILDNIKTKVIFLDSDGVTEDLAPELSQDKLAIFNEHNKRIEESNV